MNQFHSLKHQVPSSAAPIISSAALQGSKEGSLFVKINFLLPSPIDPISWQVVKHKCSAWGRDAVDTEVRQQDLVLKAFAVHTINCFTCLFTASSDVCKDTNIPGRFCKHKH